MASETADAQKRASIDSEAGIGLSSFKLISVAGVAQSWFLRSIGQWYGAWPDCGRVSRALPCLRATQIVLGAPGPPHSRAFTEVVASPPALNSTFEAAEALAATALKVLEQRDDSLVAQHLLQQARIHVPPTHSH
ncbi:hypothetical protein MTO96_021516 [Rhipicephalus appendiculatus]